MDAGVLTKCLEMVSYPNSCYTKYKYIKTKYSFPLIFFPVQSFVRQVPSSRKE